MGLTADWLLLDRFPLGERSAPITKASFARSARTSTPAFISLRITRAASRASASDSSESGHNATSRRLPLCRKRTIQLILPLPFCRTFEEQTFGVRNEARFYEFFDAQRHQLAHCSFV